MMHPSCEDHPRIRSSFTCKRCGKNWCDQHVHCTCLTEFVTHTVEWSYGMYCYFPRDTKGYKRGTIDYSLIALESRTNSPHRCDGGHMDSKPCVCNICGVTKSLSVLVFDSDWTNHKSWKEFKAIFDRLREVLPVLEVEKILQRLYIAAAVDFNERPK